MSARDALVFVVIVLIAVVMIEGIVISNASLPTGTSTQTTTVTYLDTGTNGSPTTVTVVSNQTLTVTSTAPGSNSTLTTTTTLSQDPSTVTETTTTNGTASTVTSTTTSTSVSTTTSTVTNTSTVTRTSGGQSFVTILPGTSTTAGSTMGYDPDKITVVVGVNSTVTWINDDSATHTVTSTSSLVPFDSGGIPPGGTFTFTFTVPGNYTYVCTDFPWMTGEVVVVPPK